MKMNYFATLSLAVTFLVQGDALAVEAAPNPVEKPGWILDIQDEFNGTSLDTSIWVDSYLGYRTTEERAAANYSFGGCGDSQENGCIALSITQDQETYYEGNDFKVSSIQTGQRDYLHKNNIDHQTQTINNYVTKYGYFEIRAKGYRASGYHSAFWMVGWQEDEDIDQAGTLREIDIWEDSSTPDKFGFNSYSWDSGSKDKQIEVHVPGIDDEFHIYALEWDETGVKSYVDNQLVASMGAEYSPDVPCVFLLSIYENASWTGTADTSPESYPKSLYIDYFRGYKKAATVETTLLVESGTTFDMPDSTLSYTSVLNSGTLNLNQGTLDVSGDVTNDGTFRLVDGGILQVDGSFTNNGVLDLINWSGSLPAGFINNGTVLDASVAKVSSIAADGDDINITIDGYVGHSYQLQHVENLADEWENLGAQLQGSGTGGTGISLEFVHTDAPAGTESRGFYRVAVSSP